MAGRIVWIEYELSPGLAEPSIFGWNSERAARKALAEGLAESWRDGELRVDAALGAELRGKYHRDESEESLYDELVAAAVAAGWVVGVSRIPVYRGPK